MPWKFTRVCNLHSTADVVFYITKDGLGVGARAIAADHMLQAASLCAHVERTIIKAHWDIGPHISSVPTSSM